MCRHAQAVNHPIMNEELDLRTRMYAILGVLGFVACVLAYVREFPHLNNTIGVGKLVFWAMLAALLATLAAIVVKRQRFLPLKKHLPELVLVLIVPILFAPLAASCLNRWVGRDGYHSFEFLSEKPFIPGNIALFDRRQPRPDGWELFVREGYTGYKFRYRKQAYFPISKSGDNIQLPVRRGLFGFEVVVLE